MAASIPRVNKSKNAAHLDHRDRVTWGIDFFELGHPVETELVDSDRVEVNLRSGRVTFNGDPVKADITAMRGCDLAPVSPSP